MASCPIVLHMWNYLTLPQTSMSAVQVFENIVGKGEIARNEQFLLFHSIF